MDVLVILTFSWIVLFIFFVIALQFMYGRRSKLVLKNAHVLVTGGSSGIGKSVAIYAASKGANVSLFARNQEKLQATATEIKGHFINKDQKVTYASVDLTGNFEHVISAVEKVNKEQKKPVDILVNCAGNSLSAQFENTKFEDFKYMMDVNYFSAVSVSQAVVKSMKKNGHGSIVFVSSQAGQLSFYGYTAYSGSKFALRGLAEALCSELKPYNISVTLAFPPDTDTPGFAEEQKSKPKETRLISEAGGLVSPDLVAKKIMDAALKRSFQCSVGLDGFLLSTLTAGMVPVSSAFEAFLQIFLMGPFRMIALFYLYSFDWIIHNCYKEKTKKEKAS